jgi:lauroyl/myristoyl acyltransferase
VARSASPAAAGKAPRRGLRRTLADECAATAAIFGLKLLYHLPERVAWGAAGFAGDLSYRLSRGRRDYARRNLRRVVEWMAANGMGDEYHRAAAANPRRLETLLRDAFRHHARYYVELARAPRFTTDYVIDAIGVETPAEVREWLIPNRAMILVGMHFGAIEFPGLFAVAKLGRVVAPMETVANARIQRYVYSTRATIGVRIVTLEEAGELIAALRRGEAVGLVADRDITHAGIEVEMFGAKTRIPAGPAVLAAESGAPLCVTAVRRAGRGRYLGKLYGVPVPEAASRREKSRMIVREEARLFERLICDAPEQWLSLFHPIWSDLESVPGRPRASWRHRSVGSRTSERARVPSLGAPGPVPPGTDSGERS